MAYCKTAIKVRNGGALVTLQQRQNKPLMRAKIVCSSQLEVLRMVSVFERFRKELVK